VHWDRWDGPLLVTLPLPDPAHSLRQFALEAALAGSQHGEHAMCLIYRTPADGPLYVFGRVSLVPAAVTLSAVH
jgi:hexosaminidase